MVWRKVKNLSCEARKGDMQWHLHWCRRRQEEASILVMEVPSTDVGSLNRLVAEFRVTDSVVGAKTAAGFEVQAVLDDHALARTGVEQRFLAISGDVPVRFGWARFPADGLTIEVLVEEARNAIASAGPATVRGVGANVPTPQGTRAHHLEPVDA